MVRNILELFETLAYLYCFAATYGKKMKYNIYVVIFVVAQLFLMTGMNDYGFPKYLISLSYALMFTYCILNYKSSIVQAIINIILSIFVVGIVQLLVYFVLVTIFRTDNKNSLVFELFVMIIDFIIIYFLAPKIKLKFISNYLLSRKVLSGLVITFVVIVFGSRIWKIKLNSNLQGEDFVFTVYFFLMLVLLLIEWQKTKVEAEKQKVQFQMNELYYGAYEDLILSIRKRQHDFKNHLNAIHGMIYTTNSYEELKDQQEKYMSEIMKGNEKTSILTMVENPLIAGFLSVKFREAERKGIEIAYTCRFPDRKIRIPEYELVEMFGILLDNAIEETERLADKKKIWVTLSEDGEKLYLDIANMCSESNRDNISRFFTKGYSNKGLNRGIGLYKLQEMINNYNGDIYVTQDVVENNDVIKFVITISL